MTFHLAAWSEGIAAAGTFQPIAAVPDDQIFTDGDDFRVPTGLSQMLGAFALGTGATRTRISAPSLRAFINHEIAPRNLAQVPGTDVPHWLHSFARNPLPLRAGEFINFESDGGAVGPEDVTGLAMLSDGAVQPVETEIRTIRATAAIVGTRRVWVTGNLTFTEDLPAGEYDIVGARCEEAVLAAFRLIMREGGSRPGTVAAQTAGSPDVMGARFGGWGVWGTFDINQPPTLEILNVGAVAAATQVVYLDLVRRG